MFVKTFSNKKTPAAAGVKENIAKTAKKRRSIAFSCVAFQALEKDTD